VCFYIHSFIFSSLLCLVHDFHNKYNGEHFSAKLVCSVISTKRLTLFLYILLYILLAIGAEPLEAHSTLRFRGIPGENQWHRSWSSIDVRIGGASVMARGQLPSVPYALYPTVPPVVVRKNYMCPFDPSRPLSQRKFYVKIHEMCQNTAQSMPNFFLFPVVNGHSTCC